VDSQLPSQALPASAQLLGINLWGGSSCEAQVPKRGRDMVKRIRHCKTATKRTPENVDDYISAAPTEVRAKLEEVRAAIRDVAPTAVESISYRIPFYDYKGRLTWFGLQKRHIGLYIRPPVIEEHKKDLAGYVTTLSAVHLPLDKKIPVSLVKKLVKAGMRKNEVRRLTSQA
jgi:uncharacterized protein YdhG (YjbR/CyaY superfamily)